jgi:hypothetical protein
MGTVYSDTSCPCTNSNFFSLLILGLFEITDSRGKLPHVANGKSADPALSGEEFFAKTFKVVTERACQTNACDDYSFLKHNLAILNRGN